jgi:hypothetical protein
MTLTGSQKSTNIGALEQRYDFIISHRMNGFASGVARFNELLAERLGVPMLFVFDEKLPREGRPLLSFKVSEFDAAERASLAVLLGRARWEGAGLFLHDFGGSPLEERLVRSVDWVHCGNRKIASVIATLNPHNDVLWTPGMILDARRFEPTAVSVFLFGMAHKIQTRMFGRLRDLFEQSGQTYAVYVSSVNHETASISDAQAVFDEMNEIFPRGLYFLGNLSDVGVYNYLQSSTFFSAFFAEGVRDNNTTIAAAMEHGAVVITNLDEFSPPGLQHLHNVIDINQCDELPSDPLVLRTISVNAMLYARERGWEQLAERLRAGN